jgi:isopenicillin N synthase-like dioxygenase
MVELVKDAEVTLFADFDDRFQRHDARFGIERAALGEIPTIDFSAFAKGGTDAARREVGRQIRAACIDIGFFYLANHGISAAEIDEAHGRALAFFEQPAEHKEKLYKKPGERLGILRVGGDNPDANADKASDLKEVYGMMRELMPGEPEAGRMGAGNNLWPDPAVLPGFREFMTTQIDKRVTLSQQLARGFALSLDLPESWFDAMHRFLGCTFVFNYYPAFKGGRKPTQWSISPHSDYGTFTLLSQDALGGLQVRNAAGVWIDVPPVPGSFVVNIGDLFAIWTNDLYLPSLHRALNTAEVPRISAPFFVYPQGTTMVECLETCQGPGNPPLYEPRTAEAHVMSLIDQSRRTGRPGLTTRTARRFQPVS